MQTIFPHKVNDNVLLNTSTNELEFVNDQRPHEVIRMEPLTANLLLAISEKKGELISRQELIERI